MDESDLQRDEVVIIKVFVKYIYIYIYIYIYMYVCIYVCMYNNATFRKWIISMVSPILLGCDLEF